MCPARTVGLRLCCAVSSLAAVVLLCGGACTPHGVRLLQALRAYDTRQVRHG